MNVRCHGLLKESPLLAGHFSLSEHYSTENVLGILGPISALWWNGFVRRVDRADVDRLLCRLKQPRIYGKQGSVDWWKSIPLINHLFSGSSKWREVFVIIFDSQQIFHMQNQPEPFLSLYYPVNSFILLQSYQQYSISVEKESAYLRELINVSKHSPVISQQLKEWVGVCAVSRFSITGLLLNW